MDEHALTVKTVSTGPICALILAGDLGFSATGGFLAQAVLAVDNRAERLVLDLAGGRFLDCAGAQVLAMTASFAPSGRPVIIRSLSPMARRTLKVLDLNTETLRPAFHRPPTTRPTRAWPSVSANLAPLEPGRARGPGG